MNFLIGLALRAGFGLLRLLGPRLAPALGAFLARNLGPITPAHRIGRDNIAAAFPEKSAAERAAILREAWDNLGRTACEYVHMDRIWDFDPENPKPGGHISASAETVALYERLRDDGKPAIVFSAHLANWELPAVAAAKHGIDSAVLYRTPNNAAVAREILRLRADSMGVLVPGGAATLGAGFGSRAAYRHAGGSALWARPARDVHGARSRRQSAARAIGQAL
jgi:KDO2-lipid IV(A) lauroyltransferase